MITITITISSLMVQHGGAFFSMMGYEGPQWYPVELICHSMHSSVPLLGEHSHGLELCVEHAPAGHMFKSPEWQYNM